MQLNILAVLAWKRILDKTGSLFWLRPDYLLLMIFFHSHHYQICRKPRLIQHCHPDLKTPGASDTINVPHACNCCYQSNSTACNALFFFCTITISAKNKDNMLSNMWLTLLPNCGFLWLLRNLTCLVIQFVCEVMQLPACFVSLLSLFDRGLQLDIIKISYLGITEEC